MQRKELSQCPLSGAAIRRIHGVTMLVAFAAFVFCLFFEAAKDEPFRAINPFGDDPYDAVGSIAIQIAFVCAALTYARALRLWDDPSRIGSARYILRGNVLVVCSIFATVAADATALFLHPLPISPWGRALEAGLALVFALAVVCLVALVAVFPRIGAVPLTNSTLADGIDDLWTLVRVPLRIARRILPPSWIEKVEGFHCDSLFARVPWLNPRIHPWRVAVSIGALAGVGLIAAEAREGPPPDVATGLLVAVVLLSLETAATLAGFAVFGLYLGLRRRTPERDA